MRKVLIIGDSISIGYTPYVAAALEGEYAVVHNEGNAGDSNKFLANLESYLASEADAEIIHFNCGLHDVKRARDSRGCQVDIERYRGNLREIFSRLKSTGGKLIWASTTPVIDERHAAAKPFDRREQDVLAYNAAAAKIAGEAGVTVNDLHEVVMAAGIENCVGPDGVHMTQSGYRVLGEAVAGAVAARGS